MRTAAVIIAGVAFFFFFLIAIQAAFFPAIAIEFWSSFPRNVVIVGLLTLGVVALCLTLYWQERETTTKRAALGAFRLWLTIAVVSGSPPILLAILDILRVVHVKALNIDVSVETRDTGAASVWTMVIAGLFSIFFWLQFQRYTDSGKLRFANRPWYLF
jgi:hypothetical protein